MRPLRLVFVLALAFMQTPLVCGARNAPDPPPEWTSLSATPDKVAYLVSDLIGKKMSLDSSNPTPAYIWDIEFCKTLDGKVFMLSYELQTADAYIADALSLSDFPTGTIKIHDLRDAFSSNYVVYSDPSGMLSKMQVSQVSPGSIGGGGTITAPGLGGGSTCSALLFGNCDGFCAGSCQMTGYTQCSCQGLGRCSFRMRSNLCVGSCGGSRTCNNDNAGGCGCQ